MIFRAILLLGVAGTVAGQFRSEKIRQAEHATSVAVIDLNDDGKPDIVAGGDWFQNPGWTKRVISAPASRGAPSAHSPNLGWIRSVRHLAALEDGAVVVYRQAVLPMDA